MMVSVPTYKSQISSNLFTLVSTIISWVCMVIDVTLNWKNVFLMYRLIQ